MELEDIYENVENDDTEDTTKPRTLNHSQDEGKDQKCRGSRRLVLMTVCLGIVCALLLVSIISQHISNRAERESLFKSNKNTAEEFNQTINSLQDNYTELMTEKHQLKNNFNSLSQKKLELETRVNDLMAEKNQLQRNIDSLSQNKLELENELRKLSEQAIGCLVVSNEEKSWSDSRKYCRDRGGDLVIIKSEKKQRCISSFIKEMVWIGLSDIEKEGNMTWVDNSPLKQGFWEKNEPNDAGGKEDCIELNPGKTVLNNWNDIPCSNKRKCVCEI
ncbi:CD209 antigen-like [Megalobrama amblycephala]|uniref:CD209 antigen-like n=1 Tax=Megalobrama amblycephala TaxID=75352 RepID=UPI002013FDC1|nr:CD209 antigen-like [Megalobrama amblycephala]XP_048036161.1 CD209 antigen-like [Megalobrama amblycephala]